VSGQTIDLAAVGGRLTALPPAERVRLQRRARLLAWSGIAWHLIEFAVALAAGIAASSIALIGFGADSLIEGSMPLLALAKRRVGTELNSSATVKEGAQNMLCAYLSVALLVGLLLNAAAGWWWADPSAALVIAVVALKEGRESWRGEGCREAC